MKTIYLVGGEKGGVGKSMLTLSLAEIMRTTEHVLVIDGDESNPDVFKSLKDKTPQNVEIATANLDTEGGWQVLVEQLASFTGSAIVINSPARYRLVAAKFFDYLTTAANDNGYEIKVLWPINRQRDGLVQLRSAITGYLSGIPVWVVRNLHFGDKEKFVLFDESGIRSQVAGVLDMPDLSDRVTDKIYSERINLANAEKFSYAERIAIQRYIKTLAAQFEQVQQWPSGNMQKRS